MDAPLFRSAQNESQALQKVWRSEVLISCSLSRCTHSVVAEADGNSWGYIS